MLGSLVGEPVAERGRQALRLVDGRAAAFRDLIDRQLDGAYRLAAVILGDRVEAEDAVHDAAVAAWRSFDGLRDPGRFDAWFRRILVNGCRDRLRARARHRVVNLGRELGDHEHPTMADPSDSAMTRDMLERALGELDPDHQVVVTLRFGADLTIPAIAATLGIPEGTVKSRLHHALGRLRAGIRETDR